MKANSETFIGVVGLSATLCAWPLAVHAQLEVLPDQETQQVFAGGVRDITVVFRNAGEQAAVAELRTRLLQTTSATAVLFSETLWKNIQVLPKQTILESARLVFPGVNSETRFLVQWMQGTIQVVGKTEVLVYPTNLLGELKSLAGDDERTLGIFDPQDQVKPLLKNLKVDITDLEDAGLESFHGKLAIIGPFQSKAQMREGLAKQIEALAEKGVAVVWIQPPSEIQRRSEPREEIKPSFYTVPEGKGAVVVVQAGLVSNLSESPQAQLNLVHFARLARHPEPVRLPYQAPQP